MRLIRASLSSRKMEKRCEVEKAGQCAIIHLLSDNKENRLNPRFFDDYNRALDQALSYEDVTCLVTTSEGKHFSLGIDLDLLTGASGEEMTQFIVQLQNLYCRLLTFPLVTIAAVNGHIYAGGALFGLCHDYIIMNGNKGFFCFPEVKLRLNFPASLLELAKAKLVKREHGAALVLGRRYSGEEAGAAGVVDEVCPLSRLRERAIFAGERLAGGGLDRKTLVALKRDLYRDVVQALSEPPRFYSRI